MGGATMLLILLSYFPHLALIFRIYATGNMRYCFIRLRDGLSRKLPFFLCPL